VIGALATTDHSSIVLLKALGVASMANDEHVAMLKKGVAAGNAWRRENPDIRPDLSGAGSARAQLG